MRCPLQCQPWVCGRVLSTRRLVSFRGCLAEWNAALTYTGSTYLWCYLFRQKLGALQRLGDWNVVLLRLCGMLLLAVTWQTVEGQPP
jgi:hypothetical protein